MEIVMKARNIVAAAFVLLAAGCTNMEKQAEASANGFLDAFLSNEYDKAAEYCSQEVKSELDKATADFKTLEPSIKELLVSECSKYGAEVTGATRINKSDTVEVSYRIYKKADSLSFEKGTVTGTLHVVDGKISRLGM